MIVCILGPTSSGKSNLAIKIAKKINGCIFNCDSVQIYKHFNIVSNKITNKEKKTIPHKLIDIIEPGKNFTVSDYLEKINYELNKIFTTKYTPILVGGTGLYYKAFAYQYFFPKEKKNNNINNLKKILNFILKKYGVDYIYKLLKKVDKYSADRIHKNNTIRIIRALEVYYKTGNPIWMNEKKTKGLRKDIISFGLFVKKNILYENINKQVDEMIKKGLVNELINILEKKICDKNFLYKIIGYKEIIDYLDKKISYNKAIELIKQNSRKYCKRQITWFKKHKEIIWMPFTTKKEKKNTEEHIIKYIKNSIIKS